MWRPMLPRIWVTPTGRVSAAATPPFSRYIHGTSSSPPSRLQSLVILFRGGSDISCWKSKKGRTNPKKLVVKLSPNDDLIPQVLVLGSTFFRIEFRVVDPDPCSGAGSKLGQNSRSGSKFNVFGMDYNTGIYNSYFLFSTLIFELLPCVMCMVASNSFWPCMCCTVSCYL